MIDALYADWLAALATCRANPTPDNYRARTHARIVYQTARRAAAR